MNNPRGLAVEALADVFKGDKPKETLDAIAPVTDRRDRAFFMELVYGVLRNMNLLDWVLGKFLKRPGSLKGFTINNLRIAVYQILFMRVPDFAAVNEAVQLERRNKALTNAVLRNILRERSRVESEIEDLRKLASDPLGILSKRVTAIGTVTSHPAWLIRRWIGRFDYDGALALAQANNLIPPLTLRVNRMKVTRDQVMDILGKEGMACELTRYSPYGIRLTGFHDFSALTSLRGLALVQDEAAQLVTLALDPKPGERVLDACAAPGGKATHMAELMDDQGEVVAVDFDAGRMEMMKDNIKALGLTSVFTVAGDILEAGDIGGFDRILLDAPCSSLGVIRRNPDVRYRHKATDLKSFADRQLAILRAVAPRLKSGGRLVYSTCSTEQEEGEAVVREFLKTAEDYFIIEDTLFHNKEFASSGFIRTYPHRHDMDGFFIAVLERK